MIKAISQQPSHDPYLWHVRLGHASEGIVHRFLKKYLPEVHIPVKKFFCVQCAKSKALDLKSNGISSDIPCNKPLDLCMTDVAGPFNTDINRCCFLLTMRDHASTYTFCDVLVSRSEVPKKILAWVTHLKNTCGKTPSYLRCNNAAKYVNDLKE